MCKNREILLTKPENKNDNMQKKKKWEKNDSSKEKQFRNLLFIISVIIIDTNLLTKTREFYLKMTIIKPGYLWYYNSMTLFKKNSKNKTKMILYIQIHTHSQIQLNYVN